MPDNLIPRIDWSISLGVVLHLIGLIAGGIAVWIKLSGRLDKMETLIERTPTREDFDVVKSRVDDLWEWFKTTLERRRRP